MHRTIGIVAFFYILFLATPEVRAEAFIDIYAGQSKTDKGKTDITGNVGGIAASGDVEYASSVTVGGRAGWWIGKYLGVGLDVFHFDSDLKNSSIEQGNLAIAFDLMARLPLLANEGMPQGRLQPYVTVGPAIFVSDQKSPGFTHGESASVGFKGGAGLKFLFTKHFGLFGEYRYTYFKPTQDFETTGSAPSTGEITQRIGTHHFVGGLAIHF
jgi:opacity protein-like surface antigen